MLRDREVLTKYRVCVQKPRAAIYKQTPCESVCCQSVYIIVTIIYKDRPHFHTDFFLCGIDRSIYQLEQVQETWHPQGLECDLLLTDIHSIKHTMNISKLTAIACSLHSYISIISEDFKSFNW